MPRANRYILPGGAYHLTHRCHNRSWLFRFARDRTEYCRRLRECLRSFDVSLLTYCVTSNHTHLLVVTEAPDDVSGLIRDPVWTDNVAVGSESFVTDAAERTRNRTDLDICASSDGLWTVHERDSTYDF